MNKKTIIVLFVSILGLSSLFASTNILSLNLGLSPMMAGSYKYKYKDSSSYYGKTRVSPLRFSLDIDLETYFNDKKSTPNKSAGVARYANPKTFRYQSFCRANLMPYSKTRIATDNSSTTKKTGVYHGWYNGLNLKINGDVGHITYSTGYVSKQKIADNMDISEILAFQLGFGYTPRGGGLDLGLKFDVIYTYYFTELIGINAGLGFSFQDILYSKLALYADTFVGVKFHF